MKLQLAVAAVALACASSFMATSNPAMAQSGSYCEGHRDGHRAGSDTFGMGYPGYPGCPGDPGSPGGSSTPYQRGFAAGMRQITQEMCRRNPTHQNCR